MTPSALAALHAAANRRERPWTAPEFRDLVAQPGVMLVGDDRAFILGRVILDEAEVLTLATHPQHRRQGLARAALATFERLAQQHGAARVFLEVAEDNDPARILYLASGYARIGRRPGYYTMSDGTAVAALVLEKALLNN